jgi:hypothetical protein
MWTLRLCGPLHPEPLSATEATASKALNIDKLRDDVRSPEFKRNWNLQDGRKDIPVVEPVTHRSEQLVKPPISFNRAE